MGGGERSGGYPAMGPIVEPPVEPLVDTGAVVPGPDYLLTVAGPLEARAALDAAERLVLPDGRATAWLAVDRLLTGVWGVVFLTVVLGQDTAGGDFPSRLLLVVLAAGVVVGLLDEACSRMVGLRPRRTWESRWSWLAQVLGVALVFIVLVNNDGDPRRLGAVLTVVVLGYAATPVVRWWRASRRARGGPAPWPPGSQAFALLSVLARVEAIDPDRLVGLAGLDPASGEKWLERLRAEWSVHGGRRRHLLVGDQLVGLTTPGRERLERMRVDLERLASGVPVG